MPDEMKGLLPVFLKMSTNSYLNIMDKISSSLAEEYRDTFVSVVALFTMRNLFCLFLWSGTDSIDPVFIFAYVTFSADPALCLSLAERAV